MKLMFPTLCVDNFYKNPDDIRDFALKQEFEHSSGKFPGERTKPLHELSPDLFDNFCQKLFSAYYDLQSIPISWEVETYFQKVPAFCENYESILNSGWIHHDDESSIMAGVIYLNQDSNLECGTSLFKLIDNEYEDGEDFSEAHQLKKRVFKNDPELTEEDRLLYVKNLQKNHNSFIETARFNNIYNRLVCYDSLEYHRANRFGTDVPRLTQVFFVNKIVTNYPPLDRIQQNPL